MKQLVQYIQEKLKINSNSKVTKNKLTPNDNEYKGVKFIEQHKNISKDDFKKYGSISLDLAYEIAKIIIDNCEKELNGYYFQLFYSGYSGFTILNPDFDGQNPDKYKEGLIDFHRYADNTGYNVEFNLNKSTDSTLRLKEFIGETSEKFKL